MTRTVLTLLFITCWTVFGIPCPAGQILPPAPSEDLPLLHVPEGKTRPWNPASADLTPFAITPPTAEGGAPGTGFIKPPAEYTPCSGLLLRYDGYWDFVSTEMARAAADSANGTKAYVLVANETHQQTVSDSFTAAGLEMGQVAFIQYANDAIWMRDYGPHFVWHDGTRAVVNSLYFSQRPRDDATPVIIAETLDMPLYDTPLDYAGGNFLCTDNGHGYITDITLNDNSEYSETEIAQLFLDYQGVSTLHIFPAFPFNVDGTGHIDMWMCIVDDDQVIIGEYEEVTPGYEPYVITENAATYMENLGFTVHRTPGMNDGASGTGGTHITYTNGFPLNDKIVIPVYGGEHADNDAIAIAAYQAAAPGKEIVPIDCTSIIWASGALHCICMQVPGHVDPEPVVKVIEPDGGEVVAARFSSDESVNGHSRAIRWAAEDDQAVTAIDLYYSLDGGATWPYLIASGEPHDGVYEGWLPPRTESTDCRVKVVAHDGDANSVEDASDASFSTERLQVHDYDFAHGAGVDKWAFGNFTDSWIEDLAGTRMPDDCSTPIDELQAGAYARLAFSDAEGGDADENRYRNPNPGGGNEATMIAIFTVEESAALVRSLEFHFEGYVDRAIHYEIYIWDEEHGDWADGAGAFGENNFLNNGSMENGDRVITATVTDDLDRYITGDGEVTFLIYGQSGNNPIFTDYMRLRVLYEPVFEPLHRPRNHMFNLD